MILDDLLWDLIQLSKQGFGDAIVLDENDTDFTVDKVVGVTDVNDGKRVILEFDEVKGDAK